MKFSMHFPHSARIFHTPHFLHSAFSTLRIFHTPHFLNSAFSTLLTLHTSHFPPSGHRTPHSALRTPHSALRTPHSALCVIHGTDAGSNPACSGHVIFLSFQRRMSKTIGNTSTSFFQCLQGFLGSTKFLSAT